MPYCETGVSTRIPFRKVFRSRSEVNRDLNKYVKYSNVYHSIYWFRKQEEKYDYVSGKSYKGCDYESAIINRVVLDIDAWEKTKLRDSNGNVVRDYETYTSKALTDIRRLREWGRRFHINREYRFSGGGFYFIFKAKGEPLKLRDFEINLSNELDINIDESTIGDTSRMMRTTNSFNFKPHRNCFCIPLREEELDLSFDELHSLAKKPRPQQYYVYGTETYDFTGYKIDKEKIKLKEIKINLKNIKKSDANDILEKYGWCVEDFCDCIKGILSMSHVGNFLRWELIKYLKSVVKLSFPDCVKIMVALLGGEGVHSATEKQAKYAYQSNKRFNPDWKLKPLGYCKNNCSLCKDIQSVVWDVIRNE